MKHRTRQGRLALGTVGVLAAVVGFAVAVGPGLAGSTSSRATTETGTGTTETGAKVLVCHKAKVTINVSTNAWPAHRRHGDTSGACTQAQLRKAKADKAAAREAKEKAKTERKAAKGGDSDDDDGPGQGKTKGKSSQT